MRTVASKLVLFCLLTAACVLLASDTSVFAEGVLYRIGVYTERDPAIVAKQWNPTARYLGEEIEGASFEIVPLSFEQLRSALGAEKLDFVFADPAVAVQMNGEFSLAPLLQINRKSKREFFSVFGSTIFTQVNRRDVNRLEDLKGKDIAAVDRHSLGGWLAASHEMNDIGIRPEADLNSVRFMGTQDAVIDAVLSGAVDAGVVRTSALEVSAAEAGPAMGNFKVIRGESEAATNSILSLYTNLPYVRSTRLYPEWTLMSVRFIREDVSRAVVRALGGIDPSHPAAVIGGYGAWTAGVDLRPVHIAMTGLSGSGISHRIRNLVNAAAALNIHNAKDSIANLVNAEGSRNRWMITAAVLLALAFVLLLIYYASLLRGQVRYSEEFIEEEINRRQDRERVLEEAEQRCSAVFESAAEGILIADIVSKKIIYANRTSCKMLQYNHEEIKGVVMPEVYPGNHLRKLMDRLTGEREERDGMPVTESGALIYRRDHSTFDADLSVSELSIDRRRCVLFMLTDITSLKRTQENLREREVVLRKTEDEYRKSEEAYRYLQQSMEVVEEECRKRDERLLEKEESLRYAQESLNKTEQMLKEVELDASGIRQTLDEVERVKEVPKGFIEKDDFLITNQPGGTDSLTEASLFDDVADMIKIRDGAFKIKEEEFALEHAVYESAQQAIKNSGKESVRFFCRVSADISRNVKGDESCFKRILTNILDNAFKFTEEGEVRLTLEPLKPSQNGISKDDDLPIKISIRDTGIGIPASRRDTIFDAFTHGSPEILRDYGGIGNGLTVARALTERMGGSISVESREGKGSEFVLSLNLQTP